MEQQHGGGEGDIDFIKNFADQHGETEVEGSIHINLRFLFVFFVCCFIFIFLPEAV